jgi:hypothetical protein
MMIRGIMKTFVAAISRGYAESSSEIAGR